MRQFPSHPIHPNRTPKRPPFMDILSQTPPRADHRIPYGKDENQFGDLWLPHDTRTKAPVVVFLHGGWWQSTYDLAYTGFLADDLRNHGIAVWSIEYRRLGNPGAGYPGTFLDVANAFEFTRTLAATYPLALDRVITSGHSAGGHLAFWLAGRHHIPETSLLATPKPGLAVHAAISLAGVVDLRLTRDLASGWIFSHDKPLVDAFMGGSPEEVPDHYRAGNPGDLLPLGVPQFLIQGAEDNQVPPDLPARYAANAHAQHDTASVTIIPGADHFDIVDPTSRAWPTIRDIFLRASKP